MDETTEGISTLDYLNITYTNYWCHLYKDVEEITYEVSVSDDSEISTTDLDDIDRENGDDSEEIGISNQNGNRKELPSISMQEFDKLEKTTYTSDALDVSPIEDDVNDRVSATDTVEMAEGGIYLDNKYLSRYCDKEQHYAPQLLHYCDSDINNDQHYNSHRDTVINDTCDLDNMRTCQTYYNGDLAQNHDISEFSSDFGNYKSNSCDYIDTLDSEDIFDELFVHRRHSAPGILVYDTHDIDTSEAYLELTESGSCTGLQNGYAVGITEASGCENFPDYDETVLNENNFVDDLQHSLHNEPAEARSVDEGMEMYFKDFSVIFRNDHHFNVLTENRDSSDFSDDSRVALSNRQPADFPSTCASEEATPDTTEYEQDDHNQLTTDDSPKLSKSSVALNLKNRKKKAKQKKKREQLVEKNHKPSKPKNSKFANTLEELFREEETEIDDALACPVCWELFYNPHICRPCNHVFCEPCLRKISKINHSEKRDSPCPICREPIQFCILDYELSQHVKDHLPVEHHQRKLKDGRGKHMHHPLPNKPNPLSVAGILSARRNRRNRSRFTMSPIRMDFWRFLSLFLVFLLFKAAILSVVLFVFNLGNSYVTGEKLHSFGSLFNSMSLKFGNQNQTKTWFKGCAFISGCIILLFMTRKIYKWLRLKLQI